ncbi:exo-alpha-sialidase [Aestuariirhabdus sp. LZHN29]|uniref:exo-alpha-sialidase n=1 Tax=Aestuariirhabdus sp. LZHN29 TaxID=3417462 RepID=UPI003CF20A69
MRFTHYMSRLIASLMVVAVFVSVWLLAPETPEQRIKLAQADVASPGVVFNQRLASDGKTIMVHAPSLVELPDGRLLAAWFGGSREGARDVTIDGAYYDPKSALWSSSFTLTSPALTQAGTRRFIKKLGNPVLVIGADGQLWMIYVSVSVGGWATSQLNLVKSPDLGRSWGSPRRLVTSPFFNLSTLVKGTPFYYEDGTLGVPAYHEFAGKFGEVLRLDTDGALVDKVRLTKGKESLQPIILTESTGRATSYLRYAGEDAPYRVLKTRLNSDGSWGEAVKTSIANPNSALTGFRALERNWMIANDTVDERDRLALLVEDKSGGWRVVHYFEDSSSYFKDRPDRKEFARMMDGSISAMLALQPARLPLLDTLKRRAEGEMCYKDSCYFQYDYPYAVRTTNGRIHILFTWNSSAIKHIEVSEGWLREKL